jgi:uncharacterized protein (DUF1330 family)
MHYLIANNITPDKLPVGFDAIACGETLSFEEPWSFGPPLIARLDDATRLDALKSLAPGMGMEGFAVEGFAEPGAGQAFVIAAHLMREPTGFAPYAAAVPDVVKSFGGRFLARGGHVTPVAGAFVPDRVVLIEFPSAANVVEFYFSKAYAPLLKIRLATTEPRFVLLARSGALPEEAKAALAAHVGISRSA